MKTTFPHYDCIVIGKGLIGSAAAKYLKKSFESVMIIGPDEPSNYNAAKVYASHYDQGRVQRIIGIDETWSRLNKESTDQYQNLQSESGLNFHFPVGCLYVSPFQKDNYLINAKKLATDVKLSPEFFESAESMHKKVPHFVFPDGSCGMLEMAPSGHINPMLLLKAQLNIFVKERGHSVNDTVTGVAKKNNTYTVTTESGNTYQSFKVLITAGAFSNFFGLLPQPLDLELESETVLLAQVAESEAERLSSMPSLLYELDTAELNGIYAIRPIKYPDGKFYLKLGCNLSTDISFQNLAQIQDWFRKGNSEMYSHVLQNALHAIMPDLKTVGYKTKKCIISRTKHKHCYIGATENKNLYVAAGGNGYSAMCSDALGRVAASFTENEGMPAGYSPSIFEPVVI